MAAYKANQAILLRVVVTLVFHVRQTKQFCELCQVNMAPLQNLLPFRFIPSNPHSLIVEKFSLFTTREKWIRVVSLGVHLVGIICSRRWRWLRTMIEAEPAAPAWQMPVDDLFAVE